MSDNVTVALIGAVPGFVTSFIALLAYFQGRKNAKLLGATDEKLTSKIDGNTKVTEQTRALVNGHSELLIDAVKTIAKAEGIAEERERQK